MRRCLLTIFVLSAPAAGQGADPPSAAPFESPAAFTVTSPLDELTLRAWQERQITPANRCTDEVFLRRVYLDVIGTLPEPQAVEEFLADQRPDKRAVLIETLLNRDEFADYWSLKWGDLLRIKAEFPINLWPNAVQSYHRWIRDSLAANLSYDRFVRELLTASGSNFRVPPVNFYRAIQGREPTAIAGAVALTFMGTRLESWPDDGRRNLAVFFSRVAYKTTAEWKEEIIHLDPAAVTALDVEFPDGTRARLEPGTDPRRAFADWLLQPDNPWFARNIVNRIWAWLLGRGIIHEPDDIRADNPAANPALLAYLGKELVTANYDLRHIYRLILNSSTYQQSAVPRSTHPDAEALCAYYPLRRLDAEVLIDALNSVCESTENYTSVIPEPFTIIPGEQRTITLADGSITSPFLELFGRPARDTGLESERDNGPTPAQRMHLLNSSHVQKKIENSPFAGRLLAAGKRDRRQLVRSLYVRILSRHPTAEEMVAAQEYLQTKGLPPRQGVADLAWALINTQEFLCRH